MFATLGQDVDGAPQWWCDCGDGYTHAFVALWGQARHACVISQPIAEHCTYTDSKPTVGVV